MIAFASLLDFGANKISLRYTEASAQDCFTAMGKSQEKGLIPGHCMKEARERSKKAAHSHLTSAPLKRQCNILLLIVVVVRLLYCTLGGAEHSFCALFRQSLIFLLPSSFSSCTTT